MKLSDFRDSGHWPTLLCAFTYFFVSCMVWMLIGALGNSLAAEFQLSADQKGLMVAIPVLGVESPSEYSPGSSRIGSGLERRRWAGSRLRRSRS